MMYSRRPTGSPGGYEPREAPGNVRLASSATGLTKDSVANATQIVALEKTDLTDRSGKLSRRYLKVILQGIDLVLGR